MVVNGYFHTPAALPRKGTPCTYEIGGCVTKETASVLEKGNTFARSGIQAQGFFTISHTRYAYSPFHSVLKCALLLTIIDKWLWRSEKQRENTEVRDNV